MTTRTSALSVCDQVRRRYIHSYTGSYIARAPPDVADTTAGRTGKAKGTQVWLLDRTGGEAQQFTDVKGRLSAYDWSPDGKRLLLTMADRDPNDSDEDRPAVAGPGGPKAPKPIVIERYKFKQDVQGYLTQKPARLYLYDVATKKAEALTAEGLEVASPSWSPDGQSVAFLGKEGKDAERYNTWNVYVVEARAGAAPRRITGYDGIHASASRARPEWSPDASHLVYLQSSGAKQSAYNMNRLAVVAAAGGAPKLLAEKFDRGVSAPRYARDGKSILFLVADDRWEYPATVPAGGGEVERLTKGPGVISTIEVGKDGRMAVLAASDNAPAEIFRLDDAALRPLTHHNDGLMGELKLGATEEFSCKAKDGNEVHGLIVKPPDYQQGHRYPTLLRIHGGPNGQDAHSFAFERQILAANGYVVVVVNYRGSSGRGEKYQVAISADWGNKEVVDLQAAMDYVVAAGIADPNRLGVGGLELRRHSDRRHHRQGSPVQSGHQRRRHGISAGALRRGSVRDAVRRGDRAAVEGGAGAVDRISYRFLHADQITTPTLFMGGEKDFNVPLVGGEEMYQALAQFGRTDAVSGVSRPVPRNHAAELPEGPDRAISGLVCEVSEGAGSLLHPDQ